MYNDSGLNWWDQNAPADETNTQTFDPGTRDGNTGFSGYGFPGGVTTPPLSGGQQAGGTTFRAGMTPDEVRAAVTAYFASRGKTPNPTSIDYWVSKWAEFGNNDPAYFSDRLSKADEFGGGAGGYDFGAGTKPYADFKPPNMLDDPGYQWTLGQGLKAVDANYAAKGGFNTGGKDKARMQYATGLASQSWNDTYNRAANTYGLNNNNYFTGLNSAFDKWFRTTQLGAQYS